MHTGGFYSPVLKLVHISAVYITLAILQLHPNAKESSRYSVMGSPKRGKGL